MLGFYLAAAGAFALLVLQRGLNLEHAGMAGVGLTLAGSLVSAFERKRELGRQPGDTSKQEPSRSGALA